MTSPTLGILVQNSMKTMRELRSAPVDTEQYPAVTENSLLAAAYARIIHGFILDCARVDGQRPITILQLHAASGRFAYQLMTRLAGRLSPATGLAAACGFRYVMSSARPDDLERWRAHPWLAPLMAAEVVEFLRLDEPRSQDGVWPEAARFIARDDAAPLVVIANQGHGERTGTGAPSIHARSSAADADGSEVDPAPASTSPAWLGHMRALAEDCLFLTAEPEPGAGAGESRAGRAHQALSAYTRQHGGVVLLGPQPTAHLSVAGFLFRATQISSEHTVQAFADAFDGFGPGDWLVLQPGLAAGLTSTEQLLAYIRLSEWDHRALSRCLPQLLDRVSDGQISPTERAAILHAIRMVWRSFFPETDGSRADADGEPDMAFAIGVLLFGLELCHEAIEFFEHSIRACGPSAAVRYNQALCALQLDERALALDFLSQALAHAPDFLAARDLYRRLTG